MTPKQIAQYQKAAEEGTIPDSENPLFIFSLASAKLLGMGIQGKFSFTELAKRELANRGLNLKGEWVGLAKAKQLMYKNNTGKRNKL